jgi:hypothetical protein
VTEPILLQRARLIPFVEGDSESPSGEAIGLDFNPETLQFEVTNSLGENKHEKSRQAVSEAVATLSFDAIFDHTRPGEHVPASEQPEALDVRRRTEALLEMLAARGGEDGEKPAPQRVRFSWGAIVFDGVFETYSETLEYFSAEGVPLRSSLSITLTEQEYQYEMLGDVKKKKKAQKEPRQQQAANERGPLGGQDDNSRRDRRGRVEARGRASVGAAAGADVTAGLAASAETSMSLGVEAQASAELGVDVSAQVAMEVFGQELAARKVGAEVDLSGSGLATEIGAQLAASRTTTWAPEGPRPGSRAWQAAAAVVEQRHRQGGASGAAMSGSEQVRVPIVGSPPQVQPRIGRRESAVLVERSTLAQARARRQSRSSRPSWEDDL